MYEKICSTCKQLRNETQFYKSKYHKDGYRNQCSICEKDYRDRNKGRMNNYCKERYKNKREEILEKVSIYAENNKEKISAQRKEYYARNEEYFKKRNYDRRNVPGYKAYMKEYMKKYTAEHKDRKKVLDREYFLKNKEKIMAYYSEYRNTESGKLRKKVYKHKRRVQIKQTDDGTVTKESLQELIVSQDYLCKFCGCKLDFSQKGFVQLDHIYPLSKGGTHTLGNVQFLCGPCNGSKYNNI